MSECKRCGKCCSEEICDIGILTITMMNDCIPEPPCPLLILVEGIFYCKLVLTEKEFYLEPIVTEMLGIGRGCDTILT